VRRVTNNGGDGALWAGASGVATRAVVDGTVVARRGAFVARVAVVLGATVVDGGDAVVEVDAPSDGNGARRRGACPARVETPHADAPVANRATAIVRPARRAFEPGAALRLGCAPMSRPARVCTIVVTALLCSVLFGACSSSPHTSRPGATAHGASARATPVPTASTAGPLAGAAGGDAGGPDTQTKAATTTTAPEPAPAQAPGFTDSVAAVPASQISATWRAGCPVGPAQLRLVTMRYWGFDGVPHTGTMVVNSAVASAVVRVFETLYTEHFPIRQMQPEDVYGGHDPASMAADNTSGFNCRYAVAAGAPTWSVHAYGEAVDVNPVENPYVEGGQVQPPEGAPYLDRANVRPGMAEPGGDLVTAFAAAGWQWGGRWSSSPDYQHFSATGG
jgi:hypothetical protein